jgi:hypothetical protein
MDPSLQIEVGNVTALQSQVIGFKTNTAPSGEKQGLHLGFGVDCFSGRLVQNN